MWNFLLIVGVVVVGLVGLIKVKKAKARANALKLAPQVPHPRPEGRAPGQGVPVFHGVRVVELATVVAVPSTGVMMARLGAEVIKVEDRKGDSWRNFFLQYEKGRDFSSVFEAANHGKSSVVLDLRESDAVASFKQILSEADVFITNVRLAGLQRIGLAYDDIKDEFPNLVFAHLSAWGTVGPDQEAPGYDFGAFWAMTGMSASFHTRTVYSRYPVALGDTTTGGQVLAGIATALHHRQRGGSGQLVSSSLLNNGLWCMAPLLAEQTRADVSIPDYKACHDPKQVTPLYQAYQTADKKIISVAFLDTPEREAAARERLAKQLGQDIPADNVQAYETLKGTFQGMTSDKISAHLKASGIQNTCGIFWPNHVTSDTQTAAMKRAKVQLDIPGCDKPFINHPFDMSCSDEHIVTRRAPHKGAHTEDILKNGWAKRHPKAVPPAPKQDIDAAAAKNGILNGLTVVEFSGFGVSASATTLLLSAQGAHVIKLEPEGGDLWRTRHPKFFNHLNRGKESVTYADGKAGSATIMKLLETANVFVTNAPLSKLKSLGLSYDDVKKRFPSLVYALQTPLGLHTPEDLDNCGDVGGWFASAGLCSTFGDKFAPSALPVQVGDLMASSYLYAATCSGIFHQTRTGEGQLVDCSLIRAGFWCNMSTVSIVANDPDKATLFGLPLEKAWQQHPVPTANCFVTKDGMWVQFLGVELPRHFKPILSCLGILGPVVAKLVPTVLCKVIPAKGTLFQKLEPVFVLLNASIQAAVIKKTWAEWEVIFKKHKIWYCHVSTPQVAANYKQAHAIKAIHFTSKGTMVSVPTTYSVAPNKFTEAVPAPNAQA